MSQFFASGSQSIGVSASASVFPMNIQGWFPLGWTGWISLQSKGLSRVFSNTTVQKHQSSFWEIHLCPGCSLWCHQVWLTQMTTQVFTGMWSPSSLFWCQQLWAALSHQNIGQTSQYLHCSVTQSCQTLCDPMDCSMPGLPVPHHLLEFVQVHVHCISDTIQPFRPLSPFSSAFNLSQLQGLFQWVSWLHQVTKVFELQHQSFQ